jgi:hypothetical protein
MKKLLLLLIGVITATQWLTAQSPDSRICNCFTGAVSPDLMLGTKAIYGTVGITLSRDLELKPRQLEAVKFTLPVVASKSNCRTWYTLYIADDQNKKVYELTSGSNEMTYSFPDCNRTYYVRLLVFSKSAAGGDGNCSRAISIKVTPQCITATCNCSVEKGSKGGVMSADFTLAGKVQAAPPAAGQRKYVVRFDIVNKSNCILNIQSLTVHGQTIEVPPFNTAPRAQTRGISLGFSTPATQSPPADSKVSVLVRYSLGARKCAETIELPYSQ